MPIVISIREADLEGQTDVIPRIELLASQILEEDDSLAYWSDFPEALLALLATDQVVFCVRYTQ